VATLCSRTINTIGPVTVNPSNTINPVAGVRGQPAAIILTSSAGAGNQWYKDADISATANDIKHHNRSW
jgi:hypothetical protein